MAGCAPVCRMTYVIQTPPGPGKISSRSASPVPPSESSTTSVSVSSHLKIAHWKGSSSTIASSAAPTSNAVKRQCVPPPTKPPLQTARTAASRVVTKKPPTEQAGPRGTTKATRPVRPPMWLSKAELTQEIQRLGNLCEVRTKELNRLKMETKHVSKGFDAFSALFKYMVEDLNALSVPNLTADLDNTLKKLELTKQDLAYYEREVEEIKAHHSQELNDLSNKLFEVYHNEVTELNVKHHEEIDQLQIDHQKQVENLKLTHGTSSEEIKAQHGKLVSELEQELLKQRAEMQLFHEKELKDLEEKQDQGNKVLQEHVEQLQKKCTELKQQCKNMEDAMHKDTDSKLQWVASQKTDLEKEVESLKAVLEMKNKELHSLRVQNLEMEKQLEELPFSREKIKMLQARAEDLEALLEEKTRMERKLSTENQLMKDTYEKETKKHKRLSMENEELQWRLRQAEQSLISESFLVAETPEEVVDDVIASPTKSPAPQILSKSVFFTFVDKDEASPYSPRAQYKKITPSFSSTYKTSPSKPSRSPQVPSPRKAKSHSEPPHPQSFSGTPRKMAKQPTPKNKNFHRKRAGSENCKQPDENNDSYLSIAGSMASSVGSESSVFEHKERFLEEHKEQIMASLEILREQRSVESASEDQVMQNAQEKDIIRPTNFETDMSRSAEFADPKTYYHMTFPVLRESGMVDGDTDSSKISSGNSSKGFTPTTTHSMSESNLSFKTMDNKIIHSPTSMSISASEISAASNTNRQANKMQNKGILKSAHSFENCQSSEAHNCDKSRERWRTI